MNWRLAKSLETLRSQINAAHPDRNRESDGSIGDAAHASRASDHNPNSAGVVTAIDVTNDPAHGVGGDALSQALIDSHDSRIKYIIFNHRIWFPAPGKRPQGWSKYTGPNAHEHHVHISVVADAHKYDDTAPWSLGGEVPAPAPRPARRVLKFGDEGPDVSELQVKLGVKPDGKFGNHTLFAVREWQAFHKLKADGTVGPATYKTLYPNEI